MDLNTFAADFEVVARMLAPSWSHGSKFVESYMIRTERMLAPSWSHGSKYRRPSRDASRSICWLPRGAMDLNIFGSYHLRSDRCWLPRGAMDLNSNTPDGSQRSACWLPRGAMDLN